MPKLNICEKKEKQFWKTCYTTNFSVFAKEKKTSPFFLKDLCQIYFVQKTKRTFLKTSCCRLVYKKEKKNKAFIYKASTSMTKLCSFCLRQSLPMAKKKKKTENLKTLAFGKKNSAFLFCLFRQSCFFFQLSKMKKAKNKQTRSEVFFLFVKTTILLCKTMKHFFCFTIVQNQQAFGNCLWLKKKAALFSCLRSWEVTKKVQSEICNEKVMDNFTFLWHPPTK